ENATVVRGLVSNLRDRGLDASRGVLFVIDGAKAVAKAIGQVFGEKAVIARCRVDKERNVLDHLPEAERLWVRRKLRAAWANPNPPERGAGRPGRAARRGRVNRDGGAGRRGAPAAPLPAPRLSVTGSLLKTVISTNPIESMIEIVRDHARNVKH